MFIASVEQYRWRDLDQNHKLFRDTSGQGLPEWLATHYENPKLAKYAGITVKGVAAIIPLLDELALEAQK